MVQCFLCGGKSQSNNMFATRSVNNLVKSELSRLGEGEGEWEGEGEGDGEWEGEGEGEWFPCYNFK